MGTIERLSDFDHPAIKLKATELAAGKSQLIDRVEAIFKYVRDEILFGFPQKWDHVKASETLEYGLGYCNSKATLFCALCNALEIPVRIHTGLIDIGIMRGIFPSFVFPFMPSAGGHSWTEIEFDGEWKPIDSYINDKSFYDGAYKRLQDSRRASAYSISLAKGQSSCAFNFGDEGFVHMGAVIEDHGIWDDYADYMASEKYLNMNALQTMAYPIIAWMSNRNIERIRA
jgi:hypothetical protein